MLDYWLIYRPVIEKMCSYRDMFVEEAFTFAQIHDMHALLDLAAYDNAVSMIEDK